MNLGSDFLECIELLWDIEEFNMWFPKEHGSLAYVMDRWSLTDTYQEKVDKLKTLIKSKDANEIVLYICCEIVSAAQKDNAVSEPDKANLAEFLVSYRKIYEERALSGFGIVQQEYMPDWFFEIFPGYFKLEEAKRETLILQYCKSEQMTQEQAEEAYKKLSTQYDLLNEFYFYVKNKRFKAYSPKTVEGIPAKHLYETICDTPLSAYLYLVYLREEPEKALEEYKTKMANLENKDKEEEQNITENQATCDADANVNHENTVNDDATPQCTQDASSDPSGAFVKLQVKETETNLVYLYNMGTIKTLDGLGRWFVALSALNDLTIKHIQLIDSSGKNAEGAGSTEIDVAVAKNNLANSIKEAHADTVSISTLYKGVSVAMVVNCNGWTLSVAANKKDKDALDALESILTTMNTKETVQEEKTPCLGGDFLECIALLWEIEEFNLWNPHEHGSLAYLMDRWSLTDTYQEKVDKLRTLIHSKNASEIALYISCEIVSAAHKDDAISEADRASLDANLVIQQKNYAYKGLSRFGIVQQKYMPDWFFEIFSGYFKLEKARRETLILQYCKAEQMTQEEAQAAYNKLSTQWDILNEFYFYVKNKRFKTFHPRTVEGIPAKHLYETICDTPLSAYLYLVYLREDPDKALAEYEEKIAAFNNKNKDKMEEQISMEENKQVEVEKVENEGGEQAIPTPSDDNVVLEKLEALQQAMQGLQECFDAKIAQDANQKSLIDKVHQELTRYQDGALDKIIDTIALDIIQVIDTNQGNAHIYEKKEPTEENYKKLLKILKNVTESLKAVLCRHGIESYRIPGHEVDTKRQTIVKTMPTDNQSRDGLVATRVADGYVRNDVIIRPEKIRTFKYEAPADTPANN